MKDDRLYLIHPETESRLFGSGLEEDCGFRNILVHDYLYVDPVLVWEIVEDKLAQLKRTVAQMLVSLEGSGEEPNDTPAKTSDSGL